MMNETIDCADSTPSCVLDRKCPLSIEEMRCCTLYANINGLKRLLAVKLVPTPCVPKVQIAFAFSAELNCNGEEFSSSVRVDLDF
eukprot:scaffold2811_cov126-Skeletonema_marinoi.AAC.6